MDRGEGKKENDPGVQQKDVEPGQVKGEGVAPQRVIRGPELSPKTFIVPTRVAFLEKSTSLPLLESLSLHAS